LTRQRHAIGHACTDPAQNLESDQPVIAPTARAGTFVRLDTSGVYGEHGAKLATIIAEINVAVPISCQYRL